MSCGGPKAAHGAPWGAAKLAGAGDKNDWLPTWRGLNRFNGGDIATLPRACQEVFVKNLKKSPAGNVGSLRSLDDVIRLEDRGLIAQKNFAAADELVVNPDAVLVSSGFRAGAGGAGEQAHSGRCLEHVGAERAAIDVELDAHVARFAQPGHLVAGIEDDGFGENSNQNGAVSHAQSLALRVES